MQWCSSAWKRIASALRPVSHFLEALREAVGGASGPSVDVQRPAVGLYIEARIIPSAQDSVDDDLLADFARPSTFRPADSRGGFDIPMTTGSSLLGVQVLSEDPVTQAEQYKKSMALAATLYDQLPVGRARIAGAYQRLASPRFGAVKLAKGTHEVVGGAITRISDWAPQADVSVCS